MLWWLCLKINLDFPGQLYYISSTPNKGVTMQSIVKVLMERDGLTEKEAKDQFNECKDEMNERLANGEMPYDICEEFFGLEPDYLDELIY